MGKALVIAEKPSVAAALSKALAKAPGMSRFKKNKSLDTYENDTHLIAAAIGHLVELPLPTRGGKSLRWEMDNLPILPTAFDLKPIDKTKKRFNLLKKLMKSKEVDLLINACDAGREGELIFRYLVEAAGVKKPMQRLWMQSMTSQALVDAFGHLRPDKDMLPLASAARCRSESDWLVGINGSRALTAFNSRHGGFHLTPVGRVQTPTLTILVTREQEIRSFRPRTYYEIAADFEVAAGTYGSRWFREDFRKSDDPHDRAERLWRREDAEAIVARSRGRTGTVKETTKPKKQSPPLLYDPTSLQRDASNRFGFSARRSLQAAQSLYEKHKALTYPRTDSRFLPQDYAGVVKGTLKALAEAGKGASGNLDGFARRALDEGLVKAGNRRIFNNAKVSDHFAIIPTGVIPGSRLNDAERKIYEAVARRFVAAFFGAAEFLVTTRVTRIEEDAFKTSGKVMTEPGWLAVYGKKAGEVQGNGDETAILVPVVQGEDARNTSMKLEEKETKPPARYTEATLLSAMESAGKLVEDEDLRAAMKERGLGTPATRAAIIEGLIKDKYVHREGRTLFATAKGIGLVDLLVERMHIDSLCSPELTGEWEYRLKEMEQGRLEREAFMKDIRSMTEEIVEKVRAAMKAPPPVLPDLDAKCPSCGAGPVKQTEEYYSCRAANCTFRLRKTVASRKLTEEEARALMEEGAVGPLRGFRNRAGEEFSTTLKLDKDFKVSFSYDNGSRDGTELDNPIGPCPLCAKEGRSGQLHAAPDAYVCDEHFTEAKCPARLPRTLLKVKIPQEQALKFFNEGRTDVIEHFISRKGRPFSASLVLGPKRDKLIEWEFPPSGRSPRQRARSRGAAKKKG